MPVLKENKKGEGGNALGFSENYGFRLKETLQMSEQIEESFKNLQFMFRTMRLCIKSSTNLILTH